VLALTGTTHLPGMSATVTAGPTARDHLVRMVDHPLACDIETYGLGVDARRIKAVSFANQHAAVVLDPRQPQDAELVRWVWTVCPQLILHNSAFDVPSLALNGLLEVSQIGKVWDTLITARLAWPDKLAHKGLEYLATRFLGLRLADTVEVAFRRLGMTRAEGYRSMDVDTPMYLFGAAVDAVATCRLLPVIVQAARDTLLTRHPYVRFGIKDPTHLIHREQVLNRQALKRTARGVRVDLDYLDRYDQQQGAHRAHCEQMLTQAGVRPGNAGDLVSVIDLPEGYPRTPKTGRPSTTAEHLDRLDHPLARVYVQCKQITHVQEDYLSKVRDLAIGREGEYYIHPEVSFLKATTGRMSISNPPLHQFPAEARGVVLADRGDQLTSIDWAQIEPVLIANIAHDYRILEGYESGTSDTYTDIATFARVNRKTAKTVLLGSLYGEGRGKLARDLRVSVARATQIQDQIFRTLPKVAELSWKLRQLARDHRKIFTLSGRILDIPMGRGFDGGPPSVATHKGINYFTQGGAYDLLAEALLAVDQAGLSDAVYLTMHDEIVCSTAAAADIARIMTTPPGRLVELAGRVPVLRVDRADMGKRWAAA